MYISAGFTKINRWPLKDIKKKTRLIPPHETVSAEGVTESRIGETNG